MKIGILGGTFDPIHFGHLRVAEETGQELGLQKVCLIPSSYPPHKSKPLVTHFHHRLTMARMGAAASPLLEVLDLEGKRPGFSYSIETLKELNQKFAPDPELFFILGTDAFLEIETWKDYRDLFNYAHFVIIQRPGYLEQNIEAFLKKLRNDILKSENANTYIASSGKQIIVLISTFLEISSSVIRQKVAKDQTIRFLVPESVREYIINKGLYKNDAVN